MLEQAIIDFENRVNDENTSNTQNLDKQTEKF
jgi:hypothetical protein